MWTEHVLEPGRLERLLFPRLFALAEIAWTREPDYSGFICRLPQKLLSLSSKGYEYTALEDCNPKGRRRRREAVDFLASISSSMTPESQKNSLDTAGTDLIFLFNILTKFIRPSDIPLLLKRMNRDKRQAGKLQGSSGDP